MKPIITIQDYESWMPYLLFPIYKEGWFKGFEEGFEIDEFTEKLDRCAHIGVSKLYLVNYDGVPICMYECHRIPGTVYWDTHACWFTNRRKKRILTMYAFLEKIKDRDVLACVPKDEAKGHFDITQKGNLYFMGEQNDMCIFVNR
jgi:hypothetical protein